MPEYRGIDVSEYQGSINWARVREAGKTFAMLRCGYGRYESQIDRRFEENYRAAKAAGVHVGAYLFSYATTPEQARAEAANCLRFLAGKQFEYPIAYDVETNAHQQLGRERLSAVVQAFCDVMESNGYYVSLYSNLYFLRNFLSESIRTRYDVWLAQWASAPSYNGSFGMWQYSATGSVSGISGAVDLDVAYKNYPAIMRYNGLNGFEARRIPEAGQEILLANTRLYVSSTARFHTARVSGTYYLYSAEAVNGRLRVTKRAERVGRQPEWLHVTGWVDETEMAALAPDLAIR